MMSLLGASPGHTHACSRAGCSAAAVWAIRWRNPKIHSAERQKYWLACGAHLEYLRDFLAARSFPLTVFAVSELADDASSPERHPVDQRAEGHQT